jgi:hypothetical protein
MINLIMALDLPPSLVVAALDNNGTNLVESWGLLHINNHALWCMPAFSFL